MARETFSGVDAAWLRMDRPENTADVVAVLRVRGTLPLSRLRRLLERELLAHRRFRQRIVAGALGRPAWEDDPRFRLARHLVQARLPRGRAALDAYVSGVASEPLDLRRPPWRIHLLRGTGGSAIVAKLHHCIADGFALVAVLLSLAEEPARGRRAHRARAFRDVAGAARRILRVGGRIGAVLGVPAALAALGRMIALPADPATALKRPLGGERQVACSRPFPLRAVRAEARARGVTAAELLSAAVAGAFRGWLLESGERVERDVRALVPVNLRPVGGEAAALGNEFGLVFLELPVAAAMAEERIQLVHARMEALKAGADALVTFGVLSVLGRLPVALEQRVNAFFTSKASLVLTHVPGPRRKLRLAGRRLEHVMFWVPHPATLGLGVSVLSYGGEVIVGVRADASIMPDPARLVRLFEAELGALLAAVREPRRAASGGRR
jgi:diacylglycerol O-acyltransferase